MKTLKVILIILCIFVAGKTEAQVSVGLNVGVAPLWGPAGYADARFYYLPDVEAYYDVNNSMFIYLEGGNWVHRRELPGAYAHYDLYHGYKVVLNGYRGNTPYTHFNENRHAYAKGYRGAPQRTFKEEREQGHGNVHGNEPARGHENEGHKEGGRR
jgi:hypothetical protein